MTIVADTGSDTHPAMVATEASASTLSDLDMVCPFPGLMQARVRPGSDSYVPPEPMPRTPLEQLTGHGRWPGVARLTHLIQPYLADMNMQKPGGGGSRAGFGRVRPWIRERQPRFAWLPSHNGSFPVCLQPHR
jgi:hypothetical protein